ncbi:hypothetical protein [Microbulbifer rhizosphaerae]|uniref:Uncharacterized protein n=1 Tax=Microbulbifer rhizosphaerae TaxID=1562603 RepID=A0A7W4W8Q6_9GAMM|nr:hypothetical protein [Microbulbifer rhizosphaerae]MBB3059780.1 hypothetical protein [Microbulbifer rhizosphaerae]
MNLDKKYIEDIGSLVLNCKKVLENEWTELSVVFDVSEGHIANSGFLYNGEKVRPISLSIENNPLLLDNKIYEFQSAVADQCGSKFKQILIQMENERQKIKIDFEFDNPDRWKIVPRKLKEMREALRPNFS